MNIDEILNLAKAIGELGILIIIAAVFIYMVYQNWKIKQERDNKDNNSYKGLIEEIQNQNNKLVEKLIEASQKASITPEQYENQSRIGTKINEILEQLRDCNDASRASLVQFHNGGHNLVNGSFLKMDMTNEKVKLGVALLQSEFKDQYKDLLSYWCEQLVKEGFCYVENIEDIKSIDTSMYNFFHSRHIVSIYGVSITDTKGHLIGFINVDFMAGDTQPDLDSIAADLHDKKLKIEALLSLDK